MKQTRKVEIGKRARKRNNKSSLSYKGAYPTIDNVHPAQDKTTIEDSHYLLRKSQNLRSSNFRSSEK